MSAAMCRHAKPMSERCNDCAREGDPPCPLCDTPFKGGVHSITEALAMSHLPLTWTRERPTTPGWYWVKPDEALLVLPGPIAMYLDPTEDDAIIPAYDGPMSVPRSAWFCGPIAPPKLPDAPSI